MGSGSLSAPVAALALAFVRGDRTLASRQSEADMQATPVTPTETLESPRQQSAAQPLPTNRVQRRATQQAMEDLAQRLKRGLASAAQIDDARTCRRDIW